MGGLVMVKITWRISRRADVVEYFEVDSPAEVVSAVRDTVRDGFLVVSGDTGSMEIVPWRRILGAKIEEIK